MTWKPSASLVNLRLRAQILAKIRSFFAEREVLEVETPLLSAAATTDPHLKSFRVERDYYLQTSPEFAMKRLLAAGSGAIYQIGKAFRDEEQGRQHNPEFTMLEWYRPGFDHHDLMDEMDDLLQTILGTETAERLIYADAFQKYLGINPHTATITELQKCAQINIVGLENASRDAWLHLLISHCIEPHLGQQKPTFLYNFPASQAALARVHDGVAERFEVYIQGMELANGFHELRDATEQEKRFIADLQERSIQVPYDQHLLSALRHGLPDCAGVALGIDRLVMIAANTRNIADVMSFPIDRA